MLNTLYKKRKLCRFTIRNEEEDEEQDDSSASDLDGGSRKQRVVKKYGDISNWDVSNVTNMRGMFWLYGSFNQPLNNWNVSNG